jgi:general secretion pathway protein C
VESLFANEQVLQWLERGKRLASRLPLAQLRIALYVVVAIWLMASLVRLVWTAVPVPQVVPRPQTVAQAGSTAAVQVDLLKIQGWHLFGTAGAVPVTETQNKQASTVDESAAETRLQLVLLGVIEVDIPEKGGAVIQAQGKEELFIVGEKLPVAGNVTLAKVLSDRAIINNNGRFESLMLYDETAPRAQPVAAAPADNSDVIDRRSDQNITRMAADYRQQLLSNPVSLADVIKVSVAKGDDGSVIGYKIRPGRHQKQFTDFGFQSDDVVTAINGVELNNPTKALEVYRMLREAKDATFSVKRGDEDLTLIVGLDAQQQ